ncbi:MAG: hypothetical protein H6834_10940 [Planctomycetes bacterium]|nr:hypothetical protein [Planctomycetota bacterium]MCB9891730.1 hypothetical protein [Planctomycetota bacterium]
MTTTIAKTPTPSRRIGHGVAIAFLVSILGGGSECTFRSDHRCEERNEEGECVRGGSSGNDSVDVPRGFRIRAASVLSVAHPDWHPTRRVFGVRGVESVGSGEAAAFVWHAQCILAENADWIGIAPHAVCGESWRVEEDGGVVVVSCRPAWPVLEEDVEWMRFVYEGEAGDLCAIEVHWARIP